MEKIHRGPERTGPEAEILIIEDDPDLARLISSELGKHRYPVRVASDGEKGLVELRSRPPDLIILDLLMPGLDGWEVCRSVKNDPETKEIPLMILTALAGEEDRVRGLESGADDYLVKPFSLKELLARVRALLRRTRSKTESHPGGPWEIGPLSVDLDRHEIRIAGRLLSLTPTEFSLLKHLALRPGKVFTRDQLITALWGEDRFIEEHNLDVHIHSVRQKLEPDPALPRFILTVRGVGYKLQVEAKNP
jgi:two-component system alkaline phosphatase synthesis response regulator PhoP